LVIEVCLIRRDYSMEVQATLLIERDKEEIELTLEGDYSPSSIDEDDCAREDISIEAIYLDDEAWGGTLTEEEEKRAIRALKVVGKSYRLEVTDFDKEEDESDAMSILDFEED
jgi:hypothetical protein